MRNPATDAINRSPNSNCRGAGKKDPSTTRLQEPSADRLVAEVPKPDEVQKTSTETVGHERTLERWLNDIVRMVGDDTFHIITCSHLRESGG